MSRLVPFVLSLPHPHGRTGRDRERERERESTLSLSRGRGWRRSFPSFPPSTPHRLCLCLCLCLSGWKRRSAPLQWGWTVGCRKDAVHHDGGRDTPSHSPHSLGSFQVLLPFPAEEDTQGPPSSPSPSESRCRESRGRQPSMVSDPSTLPCFGWWWWWWWWCDSTIQTHPTKKKKKKNEPTNQRKTETKKTGRSRWQGPWKGAAPCWCTSTKQPRRTKSKKHSKTETMPPKQMP